MTLRARLAIALVLFQAIAAAQWLPVRAPSEAGRPQVTFATPAETQTVGTQPAAITPKITVLIDAPLLNGSGTGNSLSKLIGARKGAGIELAAIVPTGEMRSVPVTTRAQLTAALRTLAAEAGTEPPSTSFSALLKALRSLDGQAWNSVIYMGPEPVVDPASRDYAFGLLLRTCAEKRIRLSHANTGEGAEPAWSLYLRAFGGGVSSEGPGALVDGGSELVEAKIPVAGPPEGFRVMPLSYRLEGEEIHTVPWIWSAAATVLPELPVYEEFLARRARAGSKPAAADVAALLAVNPYDAETLKLAATVAEGNHDTDAEILYHSRIVELEPSNGAVWARLALDYWKKGDTENTERCLLRARKENADPPESAAILGDIHSGRKDYGGAAAHYREALKREPERVELWLKLADTEQALNRKAETAQALEEALKRKADLWPRRTQLIEYYMEAGDGNAAKRHLSAAIPILPADASLVGKFAAYAERLQQPQEAIGLWTRVIELDPANETSYYSLAGLYRSAGDWKKVLSTAEGGLKAAPQSARLLALDADALSALHRSEEARRVLKSAAAKSSNPELLRRVADLEDRYGMDSPKYYQSLVDELRKASQPETAWRPFAERGLQVSIREGSGESCEWFAALLRSKLCDAEAPAADAPTIVAPGGYRAVLFIAHGPGQSSAEAFLADYSRTLIANTGGKSKGPLTDAYRERLGSYFRLLADLEAMGKRNGHKTAVRLSLENKNSSKITERVLALIGWRTRRESGKLVVEPATKGKRAGHQDLASALAIDVVSMQENLQAGKEFVLEIEDEPVEIFPAEKAWQEQFYAGEHYPGGLLEAMLHKPSMASLYAALSNMEQGSAALLVQSVGLKALAEKYGFLLSQYSSCLQISGGRVEVPGGTPAAPVWAALVHAQPTDPRKFLRDLMDKDDGRLLKFYFLLSQQDMRRQRFFIASLKRTNAYYEVFRDSAQVEHKSSGEVGDATLEDLFRELPIDAEGHLEFPGSPEVWMVAKGKSDSVQTTDRRLKKLSRVTTPEVEDEILLRLIRSEYNQNHMRYGSWQNLLAVLRVDAARTDPLDEASALLLAEKFSLDQGLYGYFTRLVGLNAAQYRDVFTFAEKLRGVDWKQANIASGLFHSMLYLLATAEDLGRLDPARTAALVGSFAKAMDQAQGPGQWAKVSVDALGTFLDSVKMSRDTASLREFLVTVPQDSTFTLAGHRITSGEDLRRSYDRVLELQSVPRLDEMLRLGSALDALSSGKGDLKASAAVIGEITGKFQAPEIPKKLKAPGQVLNLLGSSTPAKFTALNAQLSKEIAKKKPNPADFPKLATEYWDALAFRTMIALAGQVYAASFRADDLLISEDPLFIRKHRFVAFGPASLDYFPLGSLEVSSEDSGSFAVGGFDGLSIMTGTAAAANLRNTDANAKSVAVALLGSIRTTNWSKVSAQTLAATAVRLHAAQDLMVLAATEPQARDLVAAATYGLLSLNRRARLLLALEHRDWESVWSSVSLSDLFFLAGRVHDSMAQLKAPTPAMQEYSSLEVDPAAMLGPSLPTLRRYAAPAMVELPPYEVTATLIFPAYLGERLAEFKLYLAYLFEREGLPPEGLAAVAEVASRAVLGDIQMSDYRDWASVIAAYADFDGARLQDALGNKQEASGNQ